MHRDAILAWLFDVVVDIGMSMPTYASAVHIFDRYMEVQSVDLHDMQKLSVVCVFVASKMHDLVGTFTMLHVETYFSVLLSPKEMTDLEWRLCTKLDWKLINA